MAFKLITGVVAGLALTAASAFAADGHKHEEHRQLGAHVHGHGKLQIAVKGQTVAMEFEAPAFDIVGFGHAPETKKEKATLKAAMAKLKAPLTLFVPNAEAGCKVAKAEIEIHGPLGEAHEEHDHGHSHKEAAKKDDHGHDDHKHAEKGHADHDHDKGKHSEFEATYTLTCAKPAKLTSITVGYFKAFANAKEVAGALVGDKGAKSFEATRKTPTIKLGGGS